MRRFRFLTRSRLSPIEGRRLLWQQLGMILSCVTVILSCSSLAWYATEGDTGLIETNLILLLGSGWCWWQGRRK